MNSRSAEPMMAAAQSRAAGNREVAGQVVGVLDHEVPGVRDPFASEFHNLHLGCHLVEPNVDSTPFEADGQVGADGRASGQAVAGTDPGDNGVGGEEINRGDPAGIGHEDGGTSQPVPVVDGRARLAESPEGRQMGPDHRTVPCRFRTDPEGPRDLVSERLRAQQQLVCRAGQAQRLKTGHGPIFD